MKDRLKAPNCPKCGEFMELLRITLPQLAFINIEGWVCTKCGKKTVRK